MSKGSYNGGSTIIRTGNPYGPGPDRRGGTAAPQVSREEYAEACRKFGSETQCLSVKKKKHRRKSAKSLAIEAVGRIHLGPPAIEALRAKTLSADIDNTLLTYCFRALHCSNIDTGYLNEIRREAVAVLMSRLNRRGKRTQTR